MADPQLLADLRRAYDARAAERDEAPLADWKIEERARFLAELRQTGSRRLLELGSGPGQDAAFFQEHGCDVLCADLSAENVACCRARGLAAEVMDFHQLDLPAGRFDAAHSRNALLHAPKSEVPGILRGVARGLRPGGLFYLGLWGGPDAEGPRPGDDYDPPRFYSTFSDRRLLTLVLEVFELRYFRHLEVGQAWHYQSLILQRPA